MYTITIRDQTARQLTKVADEQATSPEELVEKAIRDLLRAEAGRILERELNVYRSLHAELLLAYPEQYVAIHHGKLIDHDVDQLALYLRIDERYPDEVILIKQVRPTVEEVYTIRSPHVTAE
ncbi:MAG: hypothetical protein U0175_00365 [Caldilineaceae bacterium]